MLYSFLFLNLSVKKMPKNETFFKTLAKIEISIFLFGSSSHDSHTFTD